MLTAIQGKWSSDILWKRRKMDEKEKDLADEQQEQNGVDEDKKPGVV